MGFIEGVLFIKFLLASWPYAATKDFFFLAVSLMGSGVTQTGWGIF